MGCSSKVLFFRAVGYVKLLSLPAALFDKSVCMSAARSRHVEDTLRRGLAKGSRNNCMLNASDYFLLVDGETPNDTPPGEEAEAEQQISGLVFAGAKLVRIEQSPQPQAADKPYSR